MWNERIAAFVVAFLFGVAVFAVWEAALSFHASNCSPQQQQAGQQTLNQQGAAAKRQSKDGDEHHDHEAVREPFVCTVAGIPTATPIFMNRNEGFFVGAFTFMLVFVTGWLLIRCTVSGAQAHRMLRS
jgi:hypothetical protein